MSSQLFTTNAGTPTVEASLQAAVRQRYGGRLLQGGILIGVLAAALGLTHSYRSAAGAIPHAVTLVLLLLAAWPRLPEWFRFSLIVAAAFLLGIGELATSLLPGVGVLYLFLAVLLAALTLSSRAAWFVGVADLLALAAVVFSRLSGSTAAPTGNQEWLTAGLILVLAAVASFAGLRALEAEFFLWKRRASSAAQELARAREAVRQVAQERTRRLRGMAEVGRSVMASDDPLEAMREAARAIQGTLRYDPVAIYWLDTTGTWLELQAASAADAAATGNLPSQIDAQGQSLVARALRERRHLSDGENGGEGPGAGFAGAAVAQAAFPLIVEERVVGVLHLNAPDGNAFAPEELFDLQDMAGQIALTVERLRLLQARGQLATDLRPAQPREAQQAPPAVQDRQHFYSTSGTQVPPGGSTIDIPLALRDQILGQISMASDKDWGPEERAMIETIASQAALALENARLIEDVRESARRSEILAAVSGRVRETLDVQTILETAARAFVQALDLEQAEIWLSASTEPKAEPASGPGQPAIPPAVSR